MLNTTPGAVRFRLSEILKSREMKQIDLAQKAGMHKQTVSRLVGGVRQIDLITIARLCDALNVGVEDLLEYIPDEKDKGS